MSQTVHHGINRICTCQQSTEWSSLQRILVWPVRRAAFTVRGWLERSRQRRALLELDDRYLKDIGLTRAAAMTEARKPFWM